MDMTDRKLLNLIQSRFPMVERPYLQLGEELGLDEQEVIGRLSVLKRKNVLRQVSAIFDTRRLGYKTMLVAMAYDPDDPNAVLDPTNPDPYYWDHVFHADDFAELLDLVQAIVDAALLAVQTVVTAEGGSSTGGTLYSMTAVLPDGTVTEYRAIVTSDGKIEILNWPQ